MRDVTQYHIGDLFIIIGIIFVKSAQYIVFIIRKWALYYWNILNQ